MKDWWKSFFQPSRFPIDDLVPQDKTAVEIRALKRLLPKKPAALLDVCCGTGRHSVPLARAGYEVTGVDQSSSYLKLARRRAAKAKAGVVFKRGDMRRLGYEGRFDAVLNLWTSFGYFPKYADDIAALKSMRRALKPGGCLILEVVDADFVRRHLQKRYWSPAGRGWLLEENEWLGGKDPAVVTERIYVAPNGTWRSSHSFVRKYNAARLARALRQAGFRGVAVHSGLLEPGVPRAQRKRVLAVGWRLS